MRALKPYTAEQIRVGARDAGLSDAQAQSLESLSGVGTDVSLGGTIGEAASAGPKIAGTALELSGRPLQAAKGAIAEGPRGALRGFEGTEQYPFIQAVLRGTGKSKAEAIRAEQSLPGAVRFAGNLGGDVLADPTTYLSFGSSVLGRAAARSMAEHIAERTLGEAATSAAKAQLYNRIMTRGFKDLTRAERAAAQEFRGPIARTFHLASHLERKARGAGGGFKVAGRTVPGTRGALSGLGPTGGGKLSELERFFTTGKGVRQAERAGTAVRGTAEQAKNTLARLHGARTLGNLREKQYQMLGQERVSGPLGHLGSFSRTKEAFTPAEKVALSDAIETDTIRGLSPRLQEVAAKLKTMRREDYEAVVAAKRLLPEDVARNLGIGIEQDRYLTHYLTPEAVKAEKQGTLISAGPKLSGAGPSWLKARSKRILASEYPRLPDGTPSVMVDPFAVGGRHGKEAVYDVTRVRAASELMDLKDEAGMPFIHTDPEAVKQLGRATDRYTVIKLPVQQLDKRSGTIRAFDQDVVVNKLIADDVANVVKFIRGGNETRTVLDAISRANSIWSRMAISTPGFAIRNIETNIWAGMVLAEARDPRDWARSMNLLRKSMQGIREAGDPFLHLKPRDRLLMEEAMRENAVGSGFVSSLQEMAKAGGEAGAKTGLRQAAHVAGKTAGGVVMGPFNALTAANRFAEEWGHLAVYMAKRRQGYSAAEAAGIVRKYLFDYQDLSQFDRGARYVNPFLTWTRKNTPLMIATALKNPGKISHVNSLLQNMRAEGEEPAGLTPEWVRQSEGVTLPEGLRKLLAKAPVVGKAAENAPLAIMPELPPVAAQQTLLPVLLAAKQLVGQGQAGGWRDVTRAAVNSLGLGGVPGGFLEWLHQTASGTEFYSGRQVPRGTEVATPAYLSWIPGVGKTIPYEAQSFIQTMMPLANRVSSVAPTSDYDRQAQGRRWLSVLSGIRGYPLDDAAARSEAYRIYDLLQAVKRGADARGIEIPETYKGASGSSKSSSGKWDW